MKEKLILLLIITLIVSVGVASANSDLGITNIQTSDTIYRGTTYFANVSITNNGPDNYSEGDKIILQADDETINRTIPEIENGSTVNILIPFGFENLGDNEIKAKLNIDSSIDSNDENNEKTKQITVLNHKPIINSDGTIIVVVGHELIYEVGELTSDEDGSLDELEYSLISAPEGMKINSTSGEVYQWTPSETGTETFTVQVSDGHDVVSKVFYVNVKQDIPEIEFQSTKLVFGDGTTERGDSVIKTIVAKNTGTQALTDLKVDLFDEHNNKIVGTPLESITMSPSTTTLNPGDSVTISIEIEIPESVDSRESLLGYLKISGDDNSGNKISDSVNVFTEAESFLDIDDCDISVDGDYSSCGHNVEVKEGSSIKIKLNVENLYSSKDINNVRVEIYDNNGWNIDERSDYFDISGGNDKEISLTFTLDNELDEDNAELTIEVYGVDEENNFKHFAEETVDLSVERENNEIRIEKYNILNNQVFDDEQFIDLELKIRNSGYNDHDHAKIEVVCPALGIDKVKKDISIKSLQTKDERLQLELPLEKTPGDYELNIYVYYDDSHMSGSVQKASLTILDSDNGGVSNSNNESQIGVTTKEQIDDLHLVDPIPEPTYGSSLDARDSPWFVALLIVVIIVILGGIAFLTSELLAIKKAKKRRITKKTKNAKTSLNNKAKASDKSGSKTKAKVSKASAKKSKAKRK